jgi:hypothetical protein
MRGVEVPTGWWHRRVGMILIAEGSDLTLDWQVPDPDDGGWTPLRTLGLYSAEALAVTAVEKYVRAGVQVPPPADTVVVLIEAPTDTFEIGKTANRWKDFGLPRFEAF